MKRYRAIVVDGKKIVRRATAFGIAVLVTAMVGINIRIADPNGELGKRMMDGRKIVGESIPGLYGTREGVFWGSAVRSLKKAICFVLTFDPWDGRTSIFGEIPIVRAVSEGYLARTANQAALAAYNPQNADMGEGMAEPETPVGESYPIKEVDSAQSGGTSKITIRNETSFSINIDEMLNEPLKFDMKGDTPKVLIVHTHGTESYSPEGASTYETDKSDRALDKEKNVVKVGTAIKAVLEENGIAVIHDTTLHDHPDFNGSYENSRKTVEGYLRKYPNICMVLDVHRDAFIYDDGSKAKFATEVNGVKAAQLMLVVGTNGGGLEHPEWRENMKLALKLQKKICEKYPKLMRGVNLRKERFNGHLTYGSLIIEVGSSGNTLSEAVSGAQFAAKEIAGFLNTLK